MILQLKYHMKKSKQRKQQLPSWISLVCTEYQYLFHISQLCNRIENIRMILILVQVIERSGYIRSSQMTPTASMKQLSDQQL